MELCVNGWAEKWPELLSPYEDTLGKCAKPLF